MGSSVIWSHIYDVFLLQVKIRCVNRLHDQKEKKIKQKEVWTSDVTFLIAIAIWNLAMNIP